MFEDPQLLGKLYGYLITHRILRTRVADNEKFFPEEKELAQAYKSVDKHSKIAFEEFLAGSGFKLVRYDAFSYPGLPQGSTCYVLIRNSMENVPQWLKPSDIYDVVIARKGHKSNTQRVLRLWFFFIWLNMLSILYKGNRPLSAISDSGRMSFSDDTLIKQITDFIEIEVRQKDDADACDSFIREVLLADNPRDLRKRVTGFLDFMTRISYLSRYRFEGQNIYTQTLVMASEIASGYSDCFAYLVNELESDGTASRGGLDGSRGGLYGSHGDLDGSHGGLDGRHGGLYGSSGGLDGSRGDLDGSTGKGKIDINQGIKNEFKSRYFADYSEGNGGKEDSAASGGKDLFDSDNVVEE
ncbi:hypothetical protein MTBBW1_2380033 [Desulfamplus magnetovallimortis]|uniref:Uncharacterized protein n=1 Tax=Desulfamplus magnetovallimortis TaxID=1246637 RepID=A0A1W1HE05_9BACT|nr:hypothetical protein [Desulfamplus magnetovallimortis]SLM30709.1 hypothetical protein MTBBW1_2380033 [Desulfamplus magnetovallimortis]